MVFHNERYCDKVTLPFKGAPKGHDPQALPTQIRDRRRATPRTQVSLDLLHSRLGHRSTRALLAADAAEMWKDVEVKLSPDPFCTSCKIATITKRNRSKVPMKADRPLARVVMDIIPAPHKSSFDPNCDFSHYLLIVDTYSRIPRLGGLNELNSEAVMDKIEEFVARYGEVNEFGWWNIGRIQADAGPQFTSEKFLRSVSRGESA